MPFGGRWFSGVACQGIELGRLTFDGGDPMTSGGFEPGGTEFGTPLERLAVLGCE